METSTGEKQFAQEGKLLEQPRVIASLVDDLFDDFRREIGERHDHKVLHIKHGSNVRGRGRVCVVVVLAREGCSRGWECLRLENVHCLGREGRRRMWNPTIPHQNAVNRLASEGSLR